jgi:hypothetical protein
VRVERGREDGKRVGGRQKEGNKGERRKEMGRRGREIQAKLSLAHKRLLEKWMISIDEG